MTLGEKIVQIRKAHELNQQAFADKFHVSRQTVSNWENDKNYPDLSTLKMISDEYGVSFDELLKEDDIFINKVDDMRKKMSTFKKALIISLTVVMALILAFFVMLYLAFQPTPDGKRINSDTTIRMLVDLPDSTPSRAITFTTDKASSDNNYEADIQKYEIDSKGGVEGDIPCVILKDNPEIIFHFQDLDYNNVLPNDIIDVSVDLKNIISDNQETKSVHLKYRYNNGKIVIDPSKIDYDSDEETGEIWYDVSFIVKYEHQGKEYTSVTTITVFNE